MTRADATRAEFPRKFGKYHLLAPLAQGGMGALYLAVTGERGFERLLVIKTILPHLADDEYVSRFRDEAKVVVKLSHGNLIPVFDAGQVDGEIFLAMDFVEGKDLRAVWNRCAKKAVAFPVDVAVYVIRELCRGLAYAHSYGDLQLVHRDISPPNLLLSYSGEVKLTDFGLASSTLKLEKTAPGIIYGKVAYMSPEQARGDVLDGRSDLYAAGIILWELLTGRQLFPPGKEQPQDLLKRARDPEVPPPSERAPRVPPELDEICLKALAADRNQRYSDAEELRQALSGWLAQAAPTTDDSRIQRFLHQLFFEDIEREREERQALIGKVGERIRKTLPPTHELRKMLEKAGAGEEIDLAAIEEAADRRKQEGPNLGRRAQDQGEEPEDRRRQAGRRAVDAAEPRVRSEGAVDVPKPRPGGRTVVTPHPAGRPESSGGIGAAAAAEAEEDGEPEPQKSSAAVIGDVLDGRYKILELIGEGGMGRVYLAEHVEIGKRVAVKILHQVYSRMPDLVERFRREARAASRIGHPHIVDVTDSGTTADGSVYFVMEYLEGVELAHVIDREGALNIGRALRVATQVCRALAAAHAVNIIHRDLKPENVFLTVKEGTSDFVKVLDFGIAKSGEAEEARTKRLTHPGMAMGTPEYMSPEQAAGKPADERCDIYAVGAILYEMLTGVPPYDGDNFMEILTKKATVDPPAPREVRPEIPEAVDALVRQAMSRDPGARPTSMEAFDYELTKCLSGRGAAVAMVLGMKTDPQLVASLNPGLRDETSRPDVWEYNSTPPPRVRLRRPVVDPGSNPPAPSSGAVAAPSGPAPVATAPEDLVGEAGISTADVPPQESLRRGGGFRLFGLLLFGGILIVGGGMLLKVMAGKPAGDVSRAGGAEPGGAAEAAKSLVEEQVAGEGSEAEGRSREKKRGRQADRRRGRGGEDRSGSAAGARPDKRRGGVAEAGPPKSKREATLLLRKANGAKADLDWERADELFRRVASGRFRSRAGFLGLAEVAFENKDLEAVIAYARKAGKSARALELIGNVHFRRGQYSRAIHYYEQVLKRRPKHEGVKQAIQEARKRSGSR